MQSNQEARSRAAQSLFDLSQRGNGQTLRNTLIDGQPARVSGTSKLPMEVCVRARRFLHLSHVFLHCHTSCVTAG
jgi:hypothetical protein